MSGIIGFLALSTPREAINTLLSDKHKEMPKFSRLKNQLTHSIADVVRHSREGKEQDSSHKQDHSGSYIGQLLLGQAHLELGNTETADSSSSDCN